MDPLQILNQNESWSMRLARGGDRHKLIGKLLGANMNTTADQAIPTLFTANIGYRVLAATGVNASGSLTTAVGGIYTAASKGGTAIVAATQVWSALTTSTLAVDLTIASTPGLTVFPAGTPLFLALTTAQGTAITADLYVYAELF